MDILLDDISITNSLCPFGGVRFISNWKKLKNNEITEQEIQSLKNIY